jgi:hypothetical protein
MNGIEVNWIASFPLKIESSELNIVTISLRHRTLILVSVATALVGEGVLVLCALEIGNRKGRCCSVACVTRKPSGGGGSISCDVRRCRRQCILAFVRSLRQVQIRYRTGSAWRCVCSGCKVRDRHGKPHPPNSNLRMGLLYSAKWDEFLLVLFFIRHQPAAAPTIVLSVAEAALTLDYLRCDFDSMAFRWRNIRHVMCFAHRRRSTQMVCTASTWICHKCYQKQYLRIHDSKPTLAF